MEQLILWLRPAGRRRHIWFSERVVFKGAAKTVTSARWISVVTYFQWKAAKTGNVTRCESLAIIIFYAIMQLNLRLPSEAFHMDVVSVTNT